jgi:serine/threonine-protein kinase HipA
MSTPTAATRPPHSQANEERRLLVSTNGRKVGTLAEQNGIWAFGYDPAWCQASDAFPLSPALPLSDAVLRDGSTHRTVQWYFDNLLPEELMREVISKEQSVAASDAFGLLERLGAESAGSLVLLPPGNPPAEQGAQSLSRDELSARIKSLPHATLSSKSPKRMSLAGAQHKMVVLFDPTTGELREPLKASASSHILKPNAHSEQYPHSVINETFTMRLARRLGLSVPPVYRLYVPEPVYLIERFDRAFEPSTQTWQRRHAIDACQLLNQPTAFKYSNATLETLSQLIQQCRSKAAARLAIFRWVLFNTLVGNSDSHLKNISFLASAEGVQLAPFYDLLCTAVYHSPMYADQAAIWPDEPLAIPIEGATVFANVNHEKLVKTGAALGLAPATAHREVNKMVQALPGEVDALIAELEKEFTAIAALSPQPETMAATLGAETHLLRGVRNIVIADMLRQVS